MSEGTAGTSSASVVDALPEGKSSATSRLIREGRWGKAEAFKDSVIAELRGKGMKRADAREEAWRRMLEKYPPLPESESPRKKKAKKAAAKKKRPLVPGRGRYAEEIAELAQMQADGEPGRIDLLRDSRWVYENMLRGDVTPRDAPGLGAWNLLQWALQNADEFYKSYLPRISKLEEGEAEKESRNGTAKINKHDARLIEDIRRRIREATETPEGVCKSCGRSD